MTEAIIELVLRKGSAVKGVWKDGQGEIGQMAG